MKLTKGVQAYQDMNAIIKPIVEKKNVRPYLSKGFRAGTDLAFLLIGLTSGGVQRIETRIIGLIKLMRL